MRNLQPGVVIIAHDNDAISYTKIAAWNARRIKQYIGLPVALITSSDVIEGFDDIIKVEKPKSQLRHFADVGERVEWANQGRWQVYDLSPYDHTILIDADYIVNSDVLNILVDTDYDLLAVRDNFDVTNLTDFAAHATVGQARLPAYWATVLSFRKSMFARTVFERWRMVAENWQHYLELYRINRRLFRNDYALSIAINAASGYCPQTVKAIPWSVATVLPEHEIELADGRWKVKFVDANNRVRFVEIHNQDLHIMGKNNLQKLINET